MKLLIVESNALYRDAFERHLSRSERFDAIEQLFDFDPVALPREVQERKPDLLLIGVGVADTKTLNVIKDIMAAPQPPGIVLHGQSLTLPAAQRVTDMLRTVNTGFAYLDTDRIQQAEDLISICVVVSDGRVVIDPPTSQRILGLVQTYTQSVESVTEAERMLLDRMARGDSDEGIAAHLGISPLQVTEWIGNIATKFGVDPTSHDARVTTTLRYLIATGKLPIDYDTGREEEAPVEPRSAPTPPLSVPPEATTEPVVDETWAPRPIDHTETVTPVIEPEVIIPERPAPTDEAPTIETQASPVAQTDMVAEFNIFSRYGQPDDTAIAGHLLAWAATRRLRVRWGTGHNEGSFAIVLDVGAQSYWLLTVYAAGHVDVQFAMLMAQFPFSDEERRKELARRVSLVPNVEVGEESLAGRPSIPLTSLANPEHLRIFTDALEWAVTAIQGPQQSSSSSEQSSRPLSQS